MVLLELDDVLGGGDVLEAEVCGYVFDDGSLPAFFLDFLWDAEGEAFVGDAEQGAAVLVSVVRSSGLMLISTRKYSLPSSHCSTACCTALLLIIWLGVLYGL